MTNNNNKTPATPGPSHAPVDPRLLDAIKNAHLSKRARQLIAHLIEHGTLNTEQLKDDYGYSHPPRVAEDAKECGIPIKTTYVPSSTGRRIAAYSLGSPDEIKSHKYEGRRLIPDAVKVGLLKTNGSICEASGELFDPQHLTVDHRIPYAIAGDATNGLITSADPSRFMLLSRGAQRQKAKSCETCPNSALDKREVRTCQRCFWANPLSYLHVATVPERYVRLVFSETEAVLYEKLVEDAEEHGNSLQGTIKKRLGESFALR